MDGLAGGDAPRMDGGREAPDGYVLAVKGVGLMTAVEDEVELERRGGLGSRMGVVSNGVVSKEPRDVGGYMLGEKIASVCGISR